MKSSALSWFELSKLPDGTRVEFVGPWDIFPEAQVPAGTTGVIKENGLNDIWCALLMLPDDQELRDALQAWDGCVVLGTHLDPGAPAESFTVDDSASAAPKMQAAGEWHKPSPLRQIGA